MKDDLATSPFTLGKALREQGRHEEAAPHLRRAVEANPCLVEAHFELGLAMLLQDSAQASEAHFEEVLALDPEHRLALLNLGNAYNNQGRCDRAADLYERALAAGPPFAMGFNNLGKALQSLGRVDEAIASYERGLELDPDGALLLGNLNTAYEAQGRPDRMQSKCEQLLSAQPDSYQAQLNLSIALRLQGKADAAAKAARRAVELDINSAAAHFHLGQARHDQKHYADAVICFENALEADPTFTPAHNSLAGTFNFLGKLDEALTLWKRAVTISPSFDVAHSNRLLCMNYHSRYSPTELADAHFAWGRSVAERIGPLEPHPNDRDPYRRLKIGYVSADLRAHPVASFIEPVLANHDPGRVEVTCYSTCAREDAVTVRLREHAHRWRHVAGQGDQALADAIRADGIDILVDLSGHTGGTRLLLFARKPAPVQVTYVGYPNTTGLEAMDWRITDRYADPPGLTEALHTEKLARLPGSFLCFEPPENSPPARPVPAHADGFFTYGCFNNLIKIGPEVVRAWARILLGAPRSRLLIKNASLSLATVRARVEGLFAAHGVPSDRLQLMARVGRDAHLSLFNQVGLHLDTFPYSGTATTFEASWMGVPTLTLAGDRHAGRVGLSHAMNLGLPELIGESIDDYVQRAIALSEPARLASVKADLRDRMSGSPLMDHVGTTRAIEAAFRSMWRAWSS